MHPPLNVTLLSPLLLCRNLTWGIRPWIELNPSPGSPAPVARDNDFGAWWVGEALGPCSSSPSQSSEPSLLLPPSSSLNSVYLANQTFLVATGSIAVQGPYASCIPKNYT